MSPPADIAAEADRLLAGLDLDDEADRERARLRILALADRLRGRLEALGPGDVRDARERNREVAARFWSELTGAIGAEARKNARRASLVDRLAGALDLGFGKEERKQGRERNDRAREAEDRRRAAEQDQLERENQANAEKYFAERTQRAGGLAGDLQDRFDAETMAGRPITQGQVAGELGRAGVADAEAIAGDVLAALQKGFEQRIQAEALASGVSPEAAEANLANRDRVGRRADALRRRRELLADHLDARADARPSQTIASESFAQAIQSGVTGRDVGREQLQRMDKQIAILEQVRRDLGQVGRLR